MVVIGGGHRAFHQPEFEIHVVRLEHQRLAIRAFRRDVAALVHVGEPEQAEHLAVRAAERDGARQRLDRLVVFAVAHQREREVLLRASIIGKFRQRRFEMFDRVGQVFVLEIDVAEREIEDGAARRA